MLLILRADEAACYMLVAPYHLPSTLKPTHPLTQQRGRRLSRPKISWLFLFLFLHLILSPITFSGNKFLRYLQTSRNTWLRRDVVNLPRHHSKESKCPRLTILEKKILESFKAIKKTISSLLKRTFSKNYEITQAAHAPETSAYVDIRCLSSTPWSCVALG
ncbi:hypothetical protein F4806DRAFT_393224 [Annulohypoxylon nitens]|nr:hypothetical protein F4806DRAFT_393224 [Annulohypoxylon nitens]